MPAPMPVFSCQGSPDVRKAPPRHSDGRAAHLRRTACRNFAPAPLASSTRTSFLGLTLCFATGAGNPLSRWTLDIHTYEWTCPSGPFAADKGLVSIYASACKRTSCATRRGDSHLRSPTECASLVAHLRRGRSLSVWTDKAAHQSQGAGTAEK